MKADEVRKEMLTIYTTGLANIKEIDSKLQFLRENCPHKFEDEQDAIKIDGSGVRFCTLCGKKF